MITGRVNSKKEAVILLSVCGVQDELHEIEALLDTGFTGYLTLPSALIAALQLAQLAIGHLTLADGSEVPSDLYQATIVWDGQSRTIEVDTLESDALVGMALMDGYDLHMHITVGGQVTLTPFSPTQSPTG